MHVEDLKALGQRFFQEQDRRQGEPPAELCASNFTAYINSNPPLNLEGMKHMAHMFYGAFPDSAQKVEESVAEGDKVVVRFAVTGTHTGELMGMPPTNKPIKIGGIAILKVENGKVVEFREEFDQFGLMQQIGAIPQ